MLLLEVATVLALILLNGVLASSEMALVSARPSRLKTMAAQGVRGSKRALALRNNASRFLSTVQIGITLVGILAGVFSGATIGTRLANWIALFLPFDIAESIAVASVVLVITYASLVIGELVPKQLALRNPETLACALAPTMTFVAEAASPLVWLLDRSSAVVLALFGASGKASNAMTEEELRTTMLEAEAAGVIEPTERRMISRLMKMADKPVRALMTHRLDVEVLDLRSARSAIQQQLMSKTSHSKIPVYDGNADEVLGVVIARDFVNALAANGDAPLRSLVRTAPVIPDTVDALEAIEMLKRSDVDMGLVHDEYGRFVGIVTSSDILEAIVGVFQAEREDSEPAIVARADGSFLVAGWTPIDELAERIGLAVPESSGFYTAAGFVLSALGRLPELGETMATAGWEIEVVDMDGQRIDKLLFAKARGPAVAADTRH